MFCRVIQLDTGDMIIGMIEDEYVDFSKYTVCVFDPVKLDSVRMQQNGMVYESFIMKTWLPMMEANYVHIQTSKVVFDTPVKAMYEEQYRLYIEAKNVPKQSHEDAPQLESDYSDNPNDIDEEFLDDEPDSPRTLH